MTQIFVALDAGGQPFELIPTLGFTTHTALVTTPEEAAWSFTPIGVRAPFEVNHPPGALASYASEDLERYGIAVLTVPSPPEGERLAGYGLELDEAAAPQIAATFEPAPPPPVPQRVSRMQAKLALHAAGLLDDVEAAIAVAPREVQIYWAEVSELHRDHTILTQMTTALGWTSEQVDDLFRTAAAIF